MRKELTALREKMQAEKVDAYLIPTTDFHGSEYVNEYFKCREYISGFTGSAGTLLVLKDRAYLWTDGRYFLQAAAQLAGSGITLMKEGEKGVPTLEGFLSETLPAGSCLGFDGRVVSCRLGKELSQRLALRYDMDLVGEVWKDRPQIEPSTIYPLPESIVGESMESKLAGVRADMKEKDADYHLITRLEEIAWLCNLRGRDVEKTPVFFAFALLSRTQDRFYVMDPSFGGLAGRAENSVAEGAEQPLTSAGSHATACPDNAERAEEGILVLPYLQIFQDLEKLPGGKILLDETVVSYSLLQAIPQGVTVINDVDPAENRKAIKNPTEIASTRRAHVKDGVAMVEFLCWLKEAAWKTQVTELSAARYLDDCRRRQTGCYDLSFVTISGYMENGAIVHYDVTPETDKTLRREGFLLVDSGGQYEEGTTDITRTIVLGSLTQTMKEHYTLVMKSHIALATAKFTKGTTGAELDKIARKPLMEAGLNYNHGTGHGVGHLLSVHEGPCTISPRGGKSLILPGMILSDEPGVYLEGQYGIRLENEVLCVEEADGMLGFEPMTWCPWEREALLKEMLTAEEICWIDDYHRRVYQTLEAHLTEPQRTWLREATLPL